MEVRVYHERACRATDRAYRAWSRIRSESASRILACILPLLLFAVPARAGLGSIAGGRLDLLVYFAYEEPDPSSWMPVFDAYSELLLNATEGQLQLGTVSFTKCADLQDAADVWVLDDNSGARAHLSGLGIPGRHIFISQTHKSTGGFALGQFGLAHESGHYLFGCYDEYRGYVGFTRQSSNLHYCTFPDSTVSCLMDGGTTISPNNTRTEFCTATFLGLTETRHNKGIVFQGGEYVRTDQEFYLGRSCWSQIQASSVGGLIAPVTAPGLGTPPHAPVTYDLERLGGDLAMALVVDTSGSMSAEERLEQAILGARSGVGLLRDQEYLSIIAFDDVPSVVLSARPMNAAARTAADVALDSLTAGGGTVLGTAVIEAVNQLALVDGCVEFLVIVTDGVSAAPNLTDPTVLAALAGGGQAVYTVAIGSFPDVSELNSIAQTTGGAFYSVSSAAELPGVLAAIFATAGSGTPVLAEFERESPNAYPSSQTFQVATRDQALRVALSFERGADLELQLVSPDGETFSVSALPGGATALSGDAYKSLTIQDPEPGSWTANVGAALSGTVTYDLLALVEGSDLSIRTTARDAEVVYPDPMAISVSVVAGVPAGGALVNADVRRPDGSEVSISLHDDGRAVHGDRVANDGVYSTLFASYAGNGAYTFDLTIDGRDASAVSNEECGRFGRGAGEEGQTGFPLEPFFACARHTLLLSGQAGAPVPGGASLRPHVELRPAVSLEVGGVPATPVAGFRLDVGDDEPLVLGPVQVDLLDLGVDTQLVDRLALHLDRDADGVLDVPSVPLALGQVTHDAVGGTRILLTAPGGELTFLEENRSHHFLLTLGEGAPSAAGLSGAGGTVASPEFGGPVSRGFRRVAILFALLFLLGALFPRKRNRRHRARPGPLQPIVLLVCLCALLAVPACGARSGELVQPPAAAKEANAQLTLAPGELRLTGAVTGAALEADGSPQVFRLELR